MDGNRMRWSGLQMARGSVRSYGRVVIDDGAYVSSTRPRPVERHLRPMRRAGISTVRSMPTDTRRACIRRQSQAESSTDASASHQIRGGWLHAGKYHNPAPAFSAKTRPAFDHGNNRAFRAG